MEHRLYLLSNWWQNRKRAYRRAHRAICSICGDCLSIELHHTSYANLWQEEDSELLWLCSQHHHRTHELARFHMMLLEEALGITTDEYNLDIVEELDWDTV